MTTNMHTIDRTIRLLLAAALVLALALGWVSGTVALVLVAVAVIFTLTAAVGFCPLYRLVGVSTGTVR